MATLGDLAKLVRSKNAGPFWLTIDIMFDNAAAYRRALAMPKSSTAPPSRAFTIATQPTS